MNKVLISLLFLTNIYAYTPSIQSLLRNSANKSLEDSSILANITITKTSKADSEELIDDLSIQNSFSYRFFNRNGRFIKFVQKNYIGSSINPQSLSSIHYVKNMSLKSIGASNIEKDFFYSVMAIFLINNESLFLEFLSNRNMMIQKNNQLVNSKQVAILNSYIAKLQSDQEEVSLVSPNISAEEKSELLDVLGQSYLQEGSILKRVKDNNNLKYRYKTDNLKFEFSAQDHSILSLEVKTPSTVLKVFARDYETYSNGYKFPKFLRIDLGESVTYKIDLKKIIIYDDNGSKFSRALDKSVKELEASKSNKNVILNRLTI